MSGKVFSIVMIVVAVVMGVLACVVPISHIMNILLVIKFFEVTVPILGAAALVKYLMWHDTGSKDSN